MTIIYDKYVNNNFSTGGTAGFLMAPLVIIGWTLDWIKNALSSLSIDWKMFVPEWIISFFSMPLLVLYCHYNLVLCFYSFVAYSKTGE